MKRPFAVILAALTLALVSGCDDVQFPTRKSNAVKQSGVVIAGHKCCGKTLASYRITIRRADGSTLGTLISFKERKRCPNGSEWPECLGRR